ncbi:LLM class flavin-dependent oxidoreductase [Actinocorallia longicatena]|uniref:LLM class flavin-dependent oxidoreductase n=1 Tax=Actinocorallia longicatena TaxID=111803 RepID=A0ABP6PYH0_9ACTN
MKFSTFHLFHRFPGQSAKDVYDYQIEVVELLEELGFDGVWLAEHHFRDYGQINNIFTMLANLAARTERLRLGTGIVVLPLHNPIRVAEEAAMVDILSNGRVQMGVGRGYQAIEFESFGMSLSEARDRFDEALNMIIELWTGDDVHFQGKFYGSGHPITLAPKPLQTPHPPIHIAAVSPETVEIYAARGLPIMVDHGTPFRKIAKAAETWHATAAAHGVDSDSVELIAARAVYVAPTIEQARADQARFEESFDRKRIFNDQSAPIDSKTGAIAKGFEYYDGKYLKGGSVGNDFRWEQLEVIGDPERVINQIKMVQEMGYSEMLCDFGSTRQLPIEEMRKTLKFFAAEVMPAFR